MTCFFYGWQWQGRTVDDGLNTIMNIMLLATQGVTWAGEGQYQWSQETLSGDLAWSVTLFWFVTHWHQTLWHWSEWWRPWVTRSDQFCIVIRDWHISGDNPETMISVWMLVTGQGGGLWQHKQNILILTRCHLQPQLTMTKQFTFSFPVLTITTICFMSRCHLTILNWNKKNVLFILLEDKCQKITTFTDSNGWMRMGMKIKWQKLQLLATVGNWNILLDSGQLYWRKFGQK